MTSSVIITAIVCGTIIILCAMGRKPTEVSDATANRCLRLLEVYLIDHQHKTIEVDTDSHGNIIMTMKHKGESK